MDLDGVRAGEASRADASYEHDRRQAARTAEWLNGCCEDDLITVRDFLDQLRLDARDTRLPVRAIEMLAAMSRVAEGAQERLTLAAAQRYAAGERIGVTDPNAEDL